MRDITNHRSSTAKTENLSVQLAEEINSFFARFETPQQQHSSASALLPSSSSPGSYTAPLTVTEPDVRRVLLAVNPRKAAGPDGVPGKINRGCLATALHAVLSHLEQRQSYVRMLFVDYSSAFNTIIPDILINKLVTLGLPPLTCAWIKDFLTNRPQTVRLGPHLSSTRTLSTGSPQGCVLSPLLYSLYTHDCSPTHNNTLIIKFADDTTVVGLISKGDEAEYREEVLKLAAWCSENNLSLNTRKTKELIVDFRRHSTDLAPLYINGECVERVHTFRFLGVLISADISWAENISAVNSGCTS
uniref:Reverse transcriptase domain-containing protein n=1 Tax=Nothobranchius korthausae TaxID=1143690 RepID=A0A1A8EWU0_9TELE